MAARADFTSGSCRMDCSRGIGIVGRMLRLDGAREGVCNLESSSSVVMEEEEN